MVIGQDNKKECHAVAIINYRLQSLTPDVYIHTIQYFSTMKRYFVIAAVFAFVACNAHTTQDNGVNNETLSADVIENNAAEEILPEAKGESGVKFTKGQVWTRYILFAVVVVVAAIFLPVYGEGVAKLIGIGEGFFGTVFLALSTSLPEIVISFMAIRQRAVDMAVGNVLGSNVFNIFILALYDIVYTKGPLLESVTPKLMVPAIGTILITTIGIIGLVYKSKLKWLMAVDSFLILLVYIFMMKVMFSTGLGH